MALGEGSSIDKGHRFARSGGVPRRGEVGMLLLGITLGFVGGSAATMLTLFIASFLKERAPAVG